MQVLEEDYQDGAWLTSAALYQTRRLFGELVANQDVLVSDAISDRFFCTLIHTLPPHEDDDYIAAAAVAVGRAVHEK